MKQLRRTLMSTFSSFGFLPWKDCEISNSKCCGISLGKYYDEENDHYFTRKHVKSPTQMERDAVCRGQYHGWLKEKVGSHIQATPSVAIRTAALESIMLLSISVGPWLTSMNTS